MNLEYISVSTVESWRQCQLKWALAHDGTPRVETTSEALLYGSAVHSFAETLAMTMGAEKCFDTVRPRLTASDTRNSGVTSSCPYPPGFATKYAEDMQTIRGWLTNLIKPSYKCHVEHKLEFELTPTLQFLGYIDFLQLKILAGESRSAYILDYKTTKQSKWREPASKSLQLKMYAAVISQQFDIPPQNITCALGFLRGQELSEWNFTETQLADTIQEVVECAETIRAVTEPQPTPSALCQYCDNRERCSYWVASIKEELSY